MLILVFQVLAIFHATRGLVVCVGPAGHVAVEDGIAAARCREAGAGHVLAAVTNSAAFSSSGCVDTPLAMVAADRGLGTRWIADAMTAATAALILRREVFAARETFRLDSFLSGVDLRSLRSVVLRI